jgi:hypothetical protein
MITINDYEAIRLHRICADCAATNENPAPGQAVGLDSDPDTGEILPAHFSWGPCELCDTSDGGHYFSGTLLIKTTTVRGN